MRSPCGLRGSLRARISRTIDTTLWNKEVDAPMTYMEYLRLAQRYRDNMKVLERRYTLQELKKHPEDYVQCLECKIHYHTYKGLYWEAYAKEPRAVPGRALRVRDKHHQKREGIRRELEAYKKQYDLT